MEESLLVETTNEFVRKNTGDNKDTKAWYALYTRPRTEKKVKERLLKNEFNVYLPLVNTIRQWSDRKKKVQLPLINGVIFIQVTQTELFEALKCEGVLSVVRYLKKPAKIRDYEINNLRILLREPDSFQHFKIDNGLARGVPVRVIRGPFLGMLGICIQKNGHHNLVIEIEALNRRLKLTLPVSFVEKEAVS